MLPHLDTACAVADLRRRELLADAARACRSDALRKTGPGPLGSLRHGLALGLAALRSRRPAAQPLGSSGPCPLMAGEPN